MVRYTTQESYTTIVTMERAVHVKKVDTIPDDAAVFHYDELNEEFKDRFPALIESTSSEESMRPESKISNGDYVKFTDYYQVTCQ